MNYQERGNQARQPQIPQPQRPAEPVVQVRTAALRQDLPGQPEISSSAQPAPLPQARTPDPQPAPQQADTAVEPAELSQARQVPDQDFPDRRNTRSDRMRDTSADPVQPQPQNPYVERRQINTGSAAAGPPTEARRSLSTVTLDELITGSDSITQDDSVVQIRPVAPKAADAPRTDTPRTDTPQTNAMPTGTPAQAAETNGSAPTSTSPLTLQDQIIDELRKQERLPTATLAKRLKMSEAELMKVCTSMFQNGELTRADGSWVVAD